MGKVVNLIFQNAEKSARNEENKMARLITPKNQEVKFTSLKRLCVSALKISYFTVLRKSPAWQNNLSIRINNNDPTLEFKKSICKIPPYDPQRDLGVYFCARVSPTPEHSKKMTQAWVLWLICLYPSSHMFQKWVWFFDYLLVFHSGRVGHMINNNSCKDFCIKVWDQQ